jgi:hypothetical protein
MSLTKLSLAGKYFNYSHPGGVWSVTSRLETGKQLTFFYSVCSWPDLEPKTLLDHPKQKPRRGRGLCRKVPLQVNFFRWRHFALESIWLISPWIKAIVSVRQGERGGGGGGRATRCTYGFNSIQSLLTGTGSRNKYFLESLWNWISTLRPCVADFLIFRVPSRRNT